MSHGPTGPGKPLAVPHRVIGEYSSCQIDPAHAVELKVFVVLPPNRQSSVRSPDLTPNSTTQPASLVDYSIQYSAANRSVMTRKVLRPPCGLSSFLVSSPRRHSACCSIHFVAWPQIIQTELYCDMGSELPKLHTIPYFY
jgi:hypothetical protein